MLSTIIKTGYMPVYRLSDKLAFPPVGLATPEGLLAVGGDLSVERLLLAYKSGIFPWYSDDDPILWWSPDPRLVLYPQEFKISKSLKKILRQQLFQVTIDTAFEQVIHACAQTPRDDRRTGTWITAEMKAAYCTLHHHGYTHSIEAWHNHQLVGGLYGVALGQAFFGESMFSAMSNASKVCLAHLVGYLQARHFTLIDCQVATPHLSSLGARTIPRKAFITQLQEAIRHPTAKGKWNA